ncbi:hypothetical protein QR680_016755 [Steinernema hermaphroditum]|uniref:Uncharacterized protein n=1 Tax=Steinernema hermaphroditum TaxID=289476 RepID=A0AA39HC70_9BILA|nr:hypothetical protein QR680_016755 [Steinernema hermaphroditum]
MFRQLLASLLLFRNVASLCPTALSEKCCRVGAYDKSRCLIPENIQKLNRSEAETACKQFPNGHLARSNHVDFTLLRTRNLVMESVGYFLDSGAHFGADVGDEERFVCEYEEPQKVDCDCAKRFIVKSLTKSRARFNIRRSKKPKTVLKTISVTTEAPTVATTLCVPRWSEWSEWSRCDGNCGACHMNNRTRTCLTKGTCDCNGPTIEEDYCGIMVCLYPKQPCCKPHKMMVIQKRAACGPQPNGVAIAKREYRKEDSRRTVSHGKKKQRKARG